MAAELEMTWVGISDESGAPYVLLSELGGGQQLRIYIGMPEAQAIALAQEGIETPMPMTHDLMCDVFSAFGLNMVRAEITALHEGSFRGSIVVDGGGEHRSISCRPSDGIALAVRTGSPIVAVEEVLDEAGRPWPLEADAVGVQTADLASDPEAVELVRRAREDVIPFIRGDQAKLTIIEAAVEALEQAQPASFVACKARLRTALEPFSFL